MTEPNSMLWNCFDDTCARTSSANATICNSPKTPGGQKPSN